MERAVVDQIKNRIGEKNLANFRQTLLKQEFAGMSPEEFAQNFVMLSIRERLFDKLSESFKFYIGPTGLGTFSGLTWGLGFNVLVSWPNYKPEPLSIIGFGLAGALTRIWFANEAKKAKEY